MVYNFWYYHVHFPVYFIADILRVVLSLFITLKYINDKKYRILAVITTILEAIFLTILLGTRVGLFGFIIAVVCYIFAEITSGLIKNKTINKKTIIIGVTIIGIILVTVITVGSTTIQRRKHLQDIEKNIVDNNEEAHITGSLLEIKNKIEDGTYEITKEGKINLSRKDMLPKPEEK